MSKANEKTALVGNEPKKFYFLQPGDQKPGNTSAQQEIEIDNVPENGNHQGSSTFSWISSFFSKPNNGYQVISQSSNPIGGKARAVPVKIEPKVFFANERTFLAWLHMAVTLASISIAIVA